MMRLTILAAALVAGVSASTPSGFKPANSDDLTVVFGTKEAVKGATVAKADTAKPPTVYTPNHLTGANYLLMMVDPDASGGGHLQWLQAVSPTTTTSSYGSSTSSALGFPLATPEAATGDYQQPSPQSASTHRYVVLLIDANNQTGIGSETLDADAQTRTPWDTETILTESGLVGNVIGSTWFVVTGAAAASGSTSSNTAAAAKTTANVASSSGPASTTSQSSGTSSTASSSSTSTSPKATANLGTGLRWDALAAVGVGAVAFAGLL